MIAPPPPPPPLHHLENGNSPTVHKEAPGLVVCLSIINTVTHLLIGAIACVAFFIANLLKGSEIFIGYSMRQHIYLCVTGYIILMSQAIMTISSNGWTRTLKYHDRRIIHLAMQILGSILAIAGSILRMSNVNRHFQSAHGSLGILAFIFACLSLIGGIINFCIKFNSNIVKIGHACFGSITITLAFLSLIFGFRTSSDDVNANMMISFTVMALLGILTQTCANFLKKLAN